MKYECQRCYRKQFDEPESEAVLDRPLDQYFAPSLEESFQRLEPTPSVVDLSLVIDNSRILRTDVRARPGRVRL